MQFFEGKIKYFYNMFKHEKKTLEFMKFSDFIDACIMDVYILNIETFLQTQVHFIVEYN